ncbi:MAG: sulfurtransferase TusA family protein [Psychrobacter sp.]|nr:sulfurtransferase TusA family protein [Psychrobacter sp.]
MTMTTLAHAIQLSPSLSGSEQQLITAHLAQLSPDSPLPSSVTLTAVVDGRGLACPLPLLKTKVALRSVNNGESLYVLATDANSTADIVAFCQQSHAMRGSVLTLSLQEQSLSNQNINTPLTQLTHQATPSDEEGKEPAQNTVTTANSDTLFHFIITKTDSN